MYTVTAAVAILLGGSNLPVLQEGKPPSEYEVKAALILNIAKFVEWPQGAFESDAAPIVLGVLGKDPFEVVLEKSLEGKKVNGRTFKIRRAARIQDLGACHIVFVSDSERDRMGAILEALANARVLTVGESAQFAAAGGVVGFFMDEKKIRFEINADAAKRAGTKFSSKLLKLARSVKEDR